MSLYGLVTGLSDLLASVGGRMSPIGGVVQTFGGKLEGMLGDEGRRPGRRRLTDSAGASLLPGAGLPDTTANVERATTSSLRYG